MAGLASFVFGLACYAVMFGTLLYLFGFLVNDYVPKGIDSGESRPFLMSLLVDLALLALFGLQHSVMARPRFKAWWTKWVPPSVERSSYVLLSSAVLILLFALWQPLPQLVWSAEASWAVTLAWSIYLIGIQVLLVATFVIDHFDLFGLRQVWLNLLQRPYSAPGFRVTFFYKHLRHPIYLGWLLIFWSTPRMSLGHLLFATGMTAYILVAVRFEERDLTELHGAEYLQYRERVPMLIPRLRRASAHSDTATVKGASH